MEKAIKEFEQIIKEWRSDDKSLRRVYAADRLQLRCVLALVKRGKLAQASVVASHLDTIVRECIPQTIWDAITEAEERAHKK